MALLADDDFETTSIDVCDSTYMYNLEALFEKVWNDTVWDTTKGPNVFISYDDFNEIMTLCEKIQEQD